MIAFQGGEGGGEEAGKILKEDTARNNVFLNTFF